MEPSSQTTWAEEFKRNCHQSLSIGALLYSPSERVPPIYNDKHNETFYCNLNSIKNVKILSIQKAFEFHYIARLLDTTFIQQNNVMS